MGEPKVRRWKKKDIPALVELQREIYADYPLHYLSDERLYTLQFNAFPEGQFLIEVDGRIVAYATSLIVQLDEEVARYTYEEITGSSTFSTHNPYGDTLYGADIGVHPDFRGQRLAAKLYQRRRRVVRQWNLRRMVAYGRLPGFTKYAGKYTPEEYVRAVATGSVKDPALTAHLRAGYEVRGVLLDYVSDRSSLNYATLLEWKNPNFDPQRRLVSSASLRRPIRRVRVCTAQFLMRRINAWEEFEQTVRFFVDTANEYHCHFLVFPEYFTAQLIYTMDEQINFGHAVRQLASLTDRYIEMMTDLSSRYSLYIIGGSTPTQREDGLYNVSYLFSPSGKHYTQDKLHVTPTEREDWGVLPGKKLRIFDTPYGRIAIQVCYDIEFPETSRLLALHGTEVIFVPFSTDERKAFCRVNFSSRARAVENYVYVVTSGNVGNLPTIKNYLVNYGRSGVYTPSDFAFPVDGVAGQADPNVETVVTADLDLETLALQREAGSVRPFFDRRPDLYTLEAKDDIEIVKVS
ncbi:MAG: bifunctional GNAT family N-acetyltransferase/carbon-nitrogen hydrolase family protein [Bdellovibrionales bacterium]|nr:bifunctional GNAT family N-acetyltransferase/carbon-nitrogen hydrolase family protein [Bdellovibrionales bacterium]